MEKGFPYRKGKMKTSIKWEGLFNINDTIYYTQSSYWLMDTINHKTNKSMNYFISRKINIKTIYYHIKSFDISSTPTSHILIFIN